MHERQSRAAFEASDVHPRMPLVAGAGVLVVLTVVLVAVRWGLSGRTADITSARVAEFASLALNDRHTPALQANPETDLERMRAVGEQRLHDYGWIDRDAGVVHIPIERAMRLYAERQGVAEGSGADE